MTGSTREQRLNNALTNALDKRKAQGTIRNLSTQPPGSVDFSSNDFLSLATSQELKDLYLEELRNGPSSLHLGSGGSRLLDGNSTYAEQLEDDIARFHRAEKGLLCNSGFDANTGLFSCLPQPDDAILYDEFIHASVHDGMRLSRAGKKLAFAHNSAAALNATLARLLRSDGEIKAGRRNVFVAVEAVYSMDGDVAPLKEILRIMHELLPLGNGHLIVDEAHSNGVLGPRGRGLVCELGLEKEVSVRLHTFGKALACNGGMAMPRCRSKKPSKLTSTPLAILLCSPLIRQYLINYARPLIYTTFMSYPALAAIRASYTYLQRGKTEAVSMHNPSLLLNPTNATTPALPLPPNPNSPPPQPTPTSPRQHTQHH